MRKLSLILLFLALGCAGLQAQTGVNANLTAADVGTCATANACLVLRIPQNVGGATFTITTNASGNTVQFEASGDNQATWVALNVTPSNSTTAVTSTTGTGTWQANVAGYTHARMRISNLVGGSTASSINPSTASARSGGGAGLPTGCTSPGSGSITCTGTVKDANTIATSSIQVVGAAAQAMNLYVSGGCDGISACTGFFWGLQAPASMAASLQYTPLGTDGTAGDALTTDGSQHLAWSVQRRTLTGTAYTNATTTFSNVVGSAGQTLQFTVAASANYKIACDIEWQGSANTTGPKWQWTGPASPTALVQYAHNPVTTSTYLDAVGSKTAFSSPMADTGTITAATDFVSHLDLELVNGVNAGTVVLQAAANGVGTLTIQPGSSCVSNGDK